MITVAMQIQELKRELAMRKSLYPNWIEQGKITQQEANKRMERLAAAIEVLSKIHYNQLTLFENNEEQKHS